MLEGETASTATQYAMFGTDEQLLPDLADNIKWGNSLIGSDFYSDKQLPMFDDEEIYRVKAFDWESDEGFGDIMRNGGFDAVIGNPPYLRIQGLQEYYTEQIQYFTMNYQSAVKRFDLYLLFAERGYHLLNEEGILGYICPHKFTNGDFGSGLRGFLVSNKALSRLLSFGNNLIFDQASTYTGILLLEGADQDAFEYYEFPDMPIENLPFEINRLPDESFAVCELTAFSDEPWILADNRTQLILNRLAEQDYVLGDITSNILVGVQSGIDNIHVVRFVEEVSQEVGRYFSQEAHEIVEIEKSLVKPFMKGEDVKRYREPIYNAFILYPYYLRDNKTVIYEEHELQAQFPLGYAYLSRYRDFLRDIRQRQKTNPKYWYSCHRSRDMSVFEAERIVTSEICYGTSMTIVPSGIYHNTTVYSITLSQQNPNSKLYYLGILNSQLMWFFMKSTGTILRGGYIRFKTNYLKPFPIQVIDFDNPNEVSQHNRMVKSVQTMLDLHKQLPKTSGAAKKVIEQQITRTDREIDALVYELYGLTDEEIALVEGTE